MGTEDDERINADPGNLSLRSSKCRIYSNAEYNLHRSRYNTVRQIAFKPILI